MSQAGVWTNRPDGADLGPAEAQVLRVLDTLGVPYEVMEIDPACADTAVFCARYGVPLEHSANALLVASKKEPKRYAACVVLATTQLDVNRRVCGLLGVPRASFATADEMRAVTGMEVGGMTPFALPAGVPLYVDERVATLPWVVVGGGGRRIKIRLAPEVFAKLGAEVVSGLGIEKRGA
jgi:prolyl-tRNA editing enzyme YbaK/EbsC (Cys-tRNA(Pro) deacylase)